ncbi:hypothetical protein GCM10023334_078060 [Nonomuraea thailandensis]
MLARVGRRVAGRAAGSGIGRLGDNAGAGRRRVGVRPGQEEGACPKVRSRAMRVSQPRPAVKSGGHTIGPKE